MYGIHYYSVCRAGRLFAEDRKNGKDNRNEIDENIINESKTDESKTNAKVMDL